MTPGLTHEQCRREMCAACGDGAGTRRLTPGSGVRAGWRSRTPQIQAVQGLLPAQQVPNQAWQGSAQGCGELVLLEHPPDQQEHHAAVQGEDAGEEGALGL